MSEQEQGLLHKPLLSGYILSSAGKASSIKAQGPLLLVRAVPGPLYKELTFAIMALI